MSDRFIDAELLPRKTYGFESITNNNFYNVEFLKRRYDAIVQKQIVYNISEIHNTKKYGVAYCIKYRPLGMSERILQRGWRNDRGLRTEDGIFNDGNI